MKSSTIKKTILSIGTLTTMAIPTLAVVACAKETVDKDLQAWDAAIKNHEFTHQNEKFDISNLSTYKGEIISWIDGDTPIVKLDAPIKGQVEWKIRVATIDTPELHVKRGNEWPETTGAEFVWAKKAKEFGDKVLPKGSRVTIASSNNGTYSRMVGSIFYKEKPNDKKYRSYSVDIVNQGLSLTTLIASQVNITESVQELMGLALADAYNNAFKHKRGLFSVNYKEILKEHGITSDVGLRWRGHKRQEGDELNVYDMLGISQGDK